MKKLYSYPYIYFLSEFFFHKYARFTRKQGKWEAISLIPLYHFYPLHTHLDICQVVTTESSPLWEPLVSE